MKLLLKSIPLIISLNVLGAPCGGAPGANHTNPDALTGGFVASTASVASTVFIDSSSSVCEKAIVQGNVRIQAGSEVSGSAKIEGRASLTSAKVKGGAQVYGSSIVTNAKICQLSQINFNVINSDYYCDLRDDEEPKHPGELGKKTLLGIDSDVDGLRDDVEIWINEVTTNTPNKNMYNERMGLKQLADKIQKGILYKDTKDKSIEFSKATLEALSCLQDIAPENIYIDLSGKLQIAVYNTMPRLQAWARIQGNFNGQSMLNNSKNKKGLTCAFDII